MADKKLKDKQAAPKAAAEVSDEELADVVGGRGFATTTVSTNTSNVFNTADVGLTWDGNPSLGGKLKR